MNNIQILLTIASIITGYLLGSIPTAYIAGRIRKGVDIRDVGTHNMGTMNVVREIGAAAGLVVLVVDAGKGILAAFIAQALGLSQVSVLLPGAAAILGHDFPVFLGFRGGKGGATAMGLLLWLMPWAVPFYLGVTLIAFLPTHNLTFAYGTAFTVFPFIAFFIYHSATLLVFALAIIAFLVVVNVEGFKEIRQRGFRESVLRRRKNSR